ncbi:hypothetical protein TNIN_211251 [Trichonephila inaurata madagascariensis]|uniref:Uncharacterized protein n=1 Tax=Trichonephila inaurata madagascariensis TaxID=2747483 RepID=A0A8X7CET2_9ARAC|nr:hypothetical protein TNIN_211251 [Trichonephila inaurata madagascariensis]
MKTTNAFNETKNKQSIEARQIRRWILKSVSDIPPEKAVTFHYIKKFLESKQNGISNHPETLDRQWTFDESERKNCKGQIGRER